MKTVQLASGRYLDTLPTGTEIAIESTGHWYWIVDLMEQAGHHPHLANALEAKKRMGKTHKTDALDAKGLAILLRCGTLPESWIPPGELRDQRELLRTRMALRDLRNGRLFGEIGDGTLSSFHSAVDAVACARELQAAVQTDAELRLRIGIHLGDVVFSNGTVLGDGVNVASRIHALAPPGGICISANVYDEIRNKPGIIAKNLGQKHLKNVSRPIGVYVLSEAPDSGGAAASSILASARTRGLAVVGAGAVTPVGVADVAAGRDEYVLGDLLGV